MIWVLYCTRRPGGIPTALIKDIFGPLGARTDWSTLGRTASVVIEILEGVLLTEAVVL